MDGEGPNAPSGEQRGKTYNVRRDAQIDLSLSLVHMSEGLDPFRAIKYQCTLFILRQLFNHLDIVFVPILVPARQMTGV